MRMKSKWQFSYQVVVVTQNEKATHRLKHFLL
uniref:Uncharacterized protein n=1 Tax=Anguilla anguilla TaxID=7936 RepID=A0A0E9VJM4_ANGAN